MEGRHGVGNGLDDGWGVGYGLDRRCVDVVDDRPRTVHGPF